jgi:hypothetical protein
MPDFSITMRRPAFSEIQERRTQMRISPRVCAYVLIVFLALWFIACLNAPVTYIMR